MSKSKSRRHFIEEVYGSIRKPMPKAGRVIETDKDRNKRKKWDIRDLVDEDDVTDTCVTGNDIDIGDDDYNEEPY